QVFRRVRVAVLGLQLHQQRDRVVGGGDDHAAAGDQRLDRAEDRGVADRVGDRLHVELGQRLVVLAAGAPLLGRLLVDRFLARALDLDVCHDCSCSWINVRGDRVVRIYYIETRGKESGGRRPADAATAAA